MLLKLYSYLTLRQVYEGATRDLTGWTGTDCSMPICVQGFFDPFCTDLPQAPGGEVYLSFTDGLLALNHENTFDLERETSAPTRPLAVEQMLPSFVRKGQEQTHTYFRTFRLFLPDAALFSCHFLLCPCRHSSQ